MAAQEDLLERSFQLAYFIFPSRAVAVRILSGALNKLKTQRGRENRRAYWRDKYLKRGITRISREEQDALQWLILFESDRFEKEQENAGGQTPESMAIRYIKNVVRMTTAMSSFYVNVGIHRLLHNYSTAETQRLYETVTERYLGADEYRRAKGALMGKLERRFGRLLRTCRTQHGELRFEPSQDQERWADLAEACLRAFIPWSTTRSCPVPSDFGAETAMLPPQLVGATAEKMDHDQVEINRCHAFIDPVCYSRLTRALAFDPPEKKLALPRFFMENTASHNNPDQSQQAPPLTPEERKSVSSQLSAEAARRRKAAAQFVTLAVDGVQCAEMDLSAGSERALEIEEGAELLEIRTSYQGDEVLLATHRVPYTEAQGIAPSRATIFLKGGNALLLDITPATTSVAGEPRRAVVRLSYRPSVLGAWQESHASLWAGIKYALAASLLLAAGWILGAKTGGDYRRLPQVKPPESFVAALPSPSTPSAQQLPTQKPPEQVSSYRLVPDDSIVRGGGGSDVPSVMVPSRPALLRLQLPVGASDGRRSLRATLRPFLAKADILSQSLRKAKSAASGAVATFWVPSTVLESNQDYAVDLRSRNSSGGLEEVNSYTFRAVAEPARGEDRSRSEEPKCSDWSDPACGASASNPLKKE
ncbi:MAG TPA: hypothetical protein VI488_13660 [Candidatus Angelobacter sp.]